MASLRCAGGGALQHQAAEAGCQRLAHCGQPGESRGEQCAAVREVLLNLHGGEKTLPLAHVDIDDRHVGAVLQNRPDQLAADACGSDDFDVRFTLH
jgi:hypothetical protein